MMTQGTGATDGGALTWPRLAVWAAVPPAAVLAVAAVVAVGAAAVTGEGAVLFGVFKGVAAAALGGQVEMVIGPWFSGGRSAAVVALPLFVVPAAAWFYAREGSPVVGVLADRGAVVRAAALTWVAWLAAFAVVAVVPGRGAGAGTHRVVAVGGWSARPLLAAVVAAGVWGAAYACVRWEEARRFVVGLVVASVALAGAVVAALLVSEGAVGAAVAPVAAAASTNVLIVGVASAFGSGRMLDVSGHQFLHRDAHTWFDPAAGSTLWALSPTVAFLVAAGSVAAMFALGRAGEPVVDPDGFGRRVRVVGAVAAVTFLVALPLARLLVDVSSMVVGPLVFARLGVSGWPLLPLIPTVLLTAAAAAGAWHAARTADPDGWAGRVRVTAPPADDGDAGDVMGPGELVGAVVGRGPARLGAAAARVAAAVAAAARAIANAVLADAVEIDDDALRPPQDADRDHRDSDPAAPALCTRCGRPLDDDGHCGRCGHRARPDPPD